jgi:CO/xanthine dehydrogenase Mo-binding subunit
MSNNNTNKKDTMTKKNKNNMNKNYTKNIDNTRINKWYGDTDFARLADDAMTPNDDASPCVTAEDRASLDAALDAVTIERDEAYTEIDRLLAQRDRILAEKRELEDMADRHAHMTNIAVGARGDLLRTRAELDKANREIKELTAVVATLAKDMIYWRDIYLDRASTLTEDKN